MAALRLDRNNPHILGLDANEMFFVEEGLILVEGQEDVVLFPGIAAQLDRSFDGTLFGWGAGGAEKFDRMCALFQSLGFQRVVAILDGDKAERAEILQAEFPAFKILVLPADDIRTKPEIAARPGKDGLIDSAGKVIPEFADGAKALIDAANDYLNSGLRIDA